MGIRGMREHERSVIIAPVSARPAVRIDWASGMYISVDFVLYYLDSG